MLLDAMDFSGSLHAESSTFDVKFTASIDELGALKLTFERCAFNRDLLSLIAAGRSGETIPDMALNGKSAAGDVFTSDNFHVTSWGHGSDLGQELSFGGTCSLAEIIRPAKTEKQQDARLWFVRQLQTIHTTSYECPVGRVTISGAKVDRHEQKPTGIIRLVHPKGTGNAEWWAESEPFLQHLVRVLSFACDSYMLPLIDQSHRDDKIHIRVLARGAAAPPYMPPFHFLNMEPIFRCACKSYAFRDDILALDPAIRWLTAAAHYDEARLIHAVSALENIIDRASGDEQKNFMKKGAFDKIASKIRAKLRELEVPAGMPEKVPELNRRSFKEKLQHLLEKRSIVTSDLPEEWLKFVINARNSIVHTGVTVDEKDNDPDTLKRIIWTREVVTRIILDRLQFSDSYRSWVHRDELLHFPSCRPMSEIAAVAKD